MGTKIIPLFDSLTHVTDDGSWFGTEYDASESRLFAELNLASPCCACVVSIAGYNMPNSLILEVCSKTPNILIPVAGFDPKSIISRQMAFQKLHELTNQGFKAIKIHPTLCNVHLDTASFDWTMEACEHANMPVFLCTIMRRRGYVPNLNPVDIVYKTYVRHAGVKVLFLHSGMADLMSYADLVRALPNALMDLSLTIMKYKNSSFDMDFNYLFKHLDRRCVVGSDFPEYTPQDVRERIYELSTGIPMEKIENICWRNLKSFLGVDFDIF